MKRQQLRGVDEEVFRRAEQADIQRKAMSARLANAKMREEARTIILGGKVYVGEVFEAGEEQLGELLMESVNRTEADHDRRKQTQLNLRID